MSKTSITQFFRDTTELKKNISKSFEYMLHPPNFLNILMNVWNIYSKYLIRHNQRNICRPLKSLKQKGRGEEMELVRLKTLRSLFSYKLCPSIKTIYLLLL